MFDRLQTKVPQIKILRHRPISFNILQRLAN
ncbi:hypothetical protein KSS87_013370 [Heliosperma pusillum]|nr:hypothetical protein KSS87_013370 [Heliosperma pusillum]